MRRGKWTPEENERLAKAVEEFGAGNWVRISKKVRTRSPGQCRKRWIERLDPSIIKGSWTPEEDQTIRDFVAENGPTKWSKLAKTLPGRAAKQCRDRWINRLNPNINKGPWTEEEDEKIVEYVNEYGSKWTLIANLLNTGRTDYDVRNRWKSSLSERVTRDRNDNLILKKEHKRKSTPKKKKNTIPQSQPLQSSISTSPQSPQDQQPQQTISVPETTTQIDSEEQEDLFPIFKQLADTNYTFDSKFGPFEDLDYPDDFQPEDPTFEVEPTIDIPMLDDPIQEFSTIDIVSSKDPTKNPSSYNEDYGPSFV